MGYHVGFRVSKRPMRSALSKRSQHDHRMTHLIGRGAAAPLANWQCWTGQRLGQQSSTSCELGEEG